MSIEGSVLAAHNLDQFLSFLEISAFSRRHCAARDFLELR